MPSTYLTKREQEIMEIIYRDGSADVSAVLDSLSANFSNSSVRTHLRILESKGHLSHREENGRFIYSPIKARTTSAKSALSTLLNTFFNDSIEQVMATLLLVKAGELISDEIARLKALIDEAEEKAANEKD